MSTLERSKEKHKHRWEMQEGYILKCIDCGKMSITSKPPKRHNGCFGNTCISRKSER